jgi:hypothetical protein
MLMRHEYTNLINPECEWVSSKGAEGLYGNYTRYTDQKIQISSIRDDNLPCVSLIPLGGKRGAAGVGRGRSAWPPRPVPSP